MERNKVERVRGRKAVEARKRFLYNEPLCRQCSTKGRTTLATQVDHIIALVNGGSDGDNNKQPLCDECHKVKTAADMGYRRRVSIGLDGWPITRPAFGSLDSLANPAGLMPSAAPLTILFGPPAAGKSTLAKEIAAKTGAVVFDLDNYFKRGARTLADAMRMRNVDLISLATKTEGEYVLLVGAAAATERAWWRDTLKPMRTVLVMCDMATSLERNKQRDSSKQARTVAGLNAWWAKYTPDDTEIYKTD